MVERDVTLGAEDLRRESEKMAAPVTNRSTDRALTEGIISINFG